jgi:uncharacterized membrane protein
MQCPVCNNEVSPQQSFCNHCGAPLAAATAPPPESAPPPPPVYTQPPAYAPPPPGMVPPPVAASSGLSDSAAGAIAYITIIPAIIFLILEPYNRNPFVRFHSIQCLGLAVVSFALQISVSILGMIVHVIPIMGAVVTGLLHLAVFVCIFIAWLMCIIKASQGQWFKLPVIGDFAEKQARS